MLLPIWGCLSVHGSQGLHPHLPFAFRIGDLGFRTRYRCGRRIQPDEPAKCGLAHFFSALRSLSHPTSVINVECCDKLKICGEHIQWIRHVSEGFCEKLGPCLCRQDRRFRSGCGTLLFNVNSFVSQAAAGCNRYQQVTA